MITVSVLIFDEWNWFSSQLMKNVMTSISCLFSGGRHIWHAVIQSCLIRFYSVLLFFNMKVLFLYYMSLNWFNPIKWKIMWTLRNYKRKNIIIQCVHRLHSKSIWFLFCLWCWYIIWHTVKSNRFLFMVGKTLSIAIDCFPVLFYVVYGNELPT